uniref:Uncharacterized protein n=1 Tax=Anguilla anguilla TaxID=7936 RepID=A0A0E9VXS1_ANGAN
MFGTKTYFFLILLCTPKFYIHNQTIHMWLKCRFLAFIKLYFVHFVFSM